MSDHSSLTDEVRASGAQQMWTQPYMLLGRGQGVSAIVAALPILAVFLLLGVWRKPAWMAGTCGLVTSLLVAVTACRMPIKVAIGASTYGIAFGLFPILWIIFWALALFRVTSETGRFEIIRNSISELTSDPRHQALLIAFGLEAFLEGAAGFGTPVAIAAAMLVGLGFSPMRAATICLLANTAPVAFGSMGIPVITLAAATGLPIHSLSVAVAALCAPLALVLPSYMLAATGGWRTLRGFLFPALAVGASFAIVQLAVCIISGPQLAVILASMVSMVVMLFLFKRHVHSPLTVEQYAFLGHADPVLPQTPTEHLQPLSTRRVLVAWLPYILLIAFAILWNVPVVQLWLDRGTLHLAWPWLDNQVLRAPPLVPSPKVYAASFLFNSFSAAGTSCMATVLAAGFLSGLGVRQMTRILLSVLLQLALPMLTISVVLAMAFVMNYSGQTAILGLALAHNRLALPFLSSLLGWLGVFVTGSDTSSNALFGNLQVVTATRLHLNPVLMAAANSAGGVMGKMISLQTIAVATVATGAATSQQSKLFRKMLHHSLILMALAGLIAFAYARLM